MSIADADDIDLGGVSASVLTLTAGGAVTDSGASTITTTNITTTGDAVTLNDGGNDFQGVVNVGTTDAGSSAANVTLTDINGIVLGAVTANGLSVTAGGDVLDTAGSAIIALGATSIVAAGADIVLDNIGIHDFAETAGFSATADNVTINDLDAIQLGAISATSLTLRASGSVTDTSGSAIVILGATSVLASNGADVFDIQLDNANTHDFSSALAFTATGEDIHVDDVNGILLGDIVATDNSGGPFDATISSGNDGDLTINAGGEIGQATGTSLTVPGLATLNSTGGAVTLTQAANAFATVTGTANAFTLVDADSVALSDMTATSGGIAVTATAGDITVGTAGSTLEAATSVDLVASGAVTVANVATPTLSITAGGTVAQESGSAWLVPGTTTVTSGSGIILAEAGNDFGIVNATGTVVSVTDRSAIVLGDINASGNLSVVAGGMISDNGATGVGEGINVLGTTSLIAASGADTFNIELNDAVNDFGTTFLGSGSAENDATTEIDVTGAIVTLTDTNAIKLGAITADALTVTAGGSITDTDGDAIVVSGATVLTATRAGAFFDIRLDGVDGVATDRPHDFAALTFLGEDVALVDLDDLTVDGTANAGTDPTIAGSGTVDINTGGALTLTDVTAAGAVTLNSDGILTLSRLTATGDIVATSGDRMRIGTVETTGGGMMLTTGEHFAIMPGNLVPLSADGNILLAAANGSFITDGETSLPTGVQGDVNSIPEGLTFTSTNGLIEFDFSIGFTITDLPNTGVVALTLDAEAAVLRIDNGFFGIGSSQFLSEAQQPGFNPFQTLASVSDPDLLLVTGDFGLVSDGDLSVRLQNTSPVFGSQDGTGTVVEGDAFLGGSFTAITLFGSFGGFSGATSALNFRDAPILGNLVGRNYPSFVQDPEHTANGCVIGTVGSCTPIGGAVPFLDFDDGRLLGIKFVDPTEDEDDPFSNRGDEEEWE